MILLFAGVLFSASLNAQLHLFLEEQEIMLEDGKVSAWVFPASADQQETLDDLKDYLKDRSDIKLKKEGDDMLIAEKVSLPALTTKRGDLIGICRITEQYYSMAVIFRMGYDITLSTAEWAAEMENLRQYVKSFMTYHYEQVYSRRVKDLEKQIKDVEKEKSQTEKKIENLTSKISNNNKKIEKGAEESKIDAFNAEIATLEADIKLLTDTLPDLQSQIDILNEKVEQNKTEVNAYLAKIATF